LLLPAAQLSQFGVSKVFDPGELERALDRLAIVVADAVEEAPMGIAAVVDEVFDADRTQRVVLR